MFIISMRYLILTAERIRDRSMNQLSQNLTTNSLLIYGFCTSCEPDFFLNRKTQYEFSAVFVASKSWKRESKTGRKKNLKNFSKKKSKKRVNSIKKRAMGGGHSLFFKKRKKGRPTLFLIKGRGRAGTQKNGSA